MGYKEDKEAFVSGTHGGPLHRINAVSLVAVTSYALCTVAHHRFLVHLRPADPRIPLVEFALLVVPLLLALTVCSPHPYALNALLAAAALAAAYLPTTLARPLPDPPLSPSLSRPPPSRQPPSPPPDAEQRPFSRPFVTSYRAVMMVMTVLCILAVDFRAFPREFAKAETWGTSLMDLGVGSFVFSLGLTAALPLLRAPDAPPLAPRGYVTAVVRSVRKSAPLVALGLVRVAMVKGVEYPEHESEYGTHWNFFFTLALLPVLGELVARLARAWGCNMHAAGLAVAFLHELALRAGGLQRWALTAPRVSLLSQNKEGLTSFPGYLAIYILGLATGLYALPPSPSFLRAHTHMRTPRAEMDDKKRAKSLQPRPEKTAEWLAAAAIWWWALFALVCLVLPTAGAATGAGARAGVSRRLANLAYVLWTAAFNCTFLVLYLAVHLVADARARAVAVRSVGPGARVGRRSSRPPALFEAVNKNGLAVFLLANLLTGLTNVSLRTLYASDATAVGVLAAYSAAVCAAAWTLRGKRVKLG
ncbi:hypothetical protein JCM3770_003025 [Rhodotorula araucariae]